MVVTVSILCSSELLCVEVNLSASQDDYEEYCLLGCNVLYVGMFVSTFRRNELSPASAANRFSFACSVYSLTLKLEAVNSSALL
jgi:hypothetical protein